MNIRKTINKVSVSLLLGAAMVVQPFAALAAPFTTTPVNSPSDIEFLNTAYITEVDYRRIHMTTFDPAMQVKDGSSVIINVTDKQKTTYGGYRASWENVGYLSDGTKIDAEFTVDKIQLKEPLDQIKPLKVFGLFEYDDPTTKKHLIKPEMVSRWEDQEPPNPSPLAQYGTLKLYKHGTKEEIKDPFLATFFDLDVPGGKGGVYTNDMWDESILFQDKYDPNFYIGTDSVLTKTQEKDGVRFSGTVQTDWADNWRRSGVATKVWSGFQFRWSAGNNAGTLLEFNTFTTSYPDLPDPVKSTPKYEVEWKDTIQFDVEQEFPHIYEGNQPKAIEFSDTLDEAFDPSTVELHVYKSSEDVTDNWTFARSGQTITAKAKDTSEGKATGKHRFHFTTKIKDDYYKTHSTVQTALEFPNTATIKITNKPGNKIITKITNTVKVKVKNPKSKVNLHKTPL